MKQRDQKWTLKAVDDLILSHHDADHLLLEAKLRQRFHDLTPAERAKVVEQLEYEIVAAKDEFNRLHLKILNQMGNERLLTKNELVALRNSYVHYVGDTDRNRDGKVELDDTGPIIELPPGLRMMDWARALFSPKTLEKYFEPIVADYQYEMIEAMLKSKSVPPLRYIAVRHWLGFIIAVLLVASAGIGKVIKSIKGA